MRVTRKIIDIDEELCNGCGQCVPSCAEGALAIVGGKARLIAEKYCDGLGACLGKCPTGALKIIQRQAEDFNEEAVEELLRPKEEQPDQAAGQPALGCGCPSTRLQSFQPASSACAVANQPVTTTGVAGSALTHWPVQIRLIPSTAPFLEGADLLVVADCTPVAYPRLHQDLLPNRVVMMGCPKFDDVEAYIQKFAEIFMIAGITSIVIARMEVPCCASLRTIVDKALERAGKPIPLEEIVISAQGEIVRQEQVAA